MSCRDKILVVSEADAAWEFMSDTWTPLNLEISGNKAKIHQLAGNELSTLAICSGEVFDIRSGAQIPVPGEVVDVACGLEHFVALTKQGDVYTWGNAL